MFKYVFNISDSFVTFQFGMKILNKPYKRNNSDKHGFIKIRNQVP